MLAELSLGVTRLLVEAKNQKPWTDSWLADKAKD